MFSSENKIVESIFWKLTEKNSIFFWNPLLKTALFSFQLMNFTQGYVEGKGLPLIIESGKDKPTRVLLMSHPNRNVALIYSENPEDVQVMG